MENWSCADSLRRFYRAREPWLLDRIQDYTLLETPSNEPNQTDALATRIEADLARLGASVHVAASRPRPVHGTFGFGQPELFLVFHHDTVWPVGSFTSRRERERWYAPGIFDMKANLPLAMLSLEYFADNRPGLLQRMAFISSPDEEILGPVSSQSLPQLVVPGSWALVFEPPAAGGAFKQRRKGVGRLQIQFRGVAAHAGNHYERGRSALRAAARLLLAAEGLSDPISGLTVNAGLLRGGSAANTRPASAQMTLDVRFHDVAQWHAVRTFLNGFRDPDGVELLIEAPAYVPPMNSMHEGWSQLERVCQSLGLPFRTVLAGGGSDGSVLAAAGLLVLDGLGVGGGGEHAVDEHIEMAALEPAFVRNCRLIESLLGGPAAV